MSGSEPVTASGLEPVTASGLEPAMVSGLELANVAPRYGEASLADVLPSVLASLGVPGAVDSLGLSSGPLAEVRRVVVLLVDGLGYHLLPLMAGSAPTVTELAAGQLPGMTARAITAGFPSTTPTSLASLGTGAPPGAHGLVGFTLNVPGTDRVLNHIDWRDEPDPLRWQPLATQFDRAEAAGVRTHIVSPAEMANSGLTMAAYRGGSYVGAGGVGRSVDSLAEQVLAALCRDPGPALVYGYHPTLDVIGHLCGVDSPQWSLAAAEVDRLVTLIRAGLPPDAALVITADHGQLNIPADHRFDLDGDARLRSGVRVVAGEPRVRYLHVAPGAVADVMATWRGVLGAAAWVASREEAVAAGWFGPVAEDHLARIGDVVVACHGDYAVLATQTEPERISALIAFHGSATAVEMMIPLLVARS